MSIDEMPDASVSKDNLVVRRCCIGLCGLIGAVGVVTLIFIFVLFQEP